MDLIGREDDIGSIRAHFDDAGLRGGALLVIGDAGVGKTAVLDEFAAGEVEVEGGTHVDVVHPSHPVWPTVVEWIHETVTSKGKP